MERRLLPIRRCISCVLPLTLPTEASRTVLVWVALGRSEYSAGTHYPLLKKTITEVMGESVTLIDSAYETAREIKNVLGESGRLRQAGLPPEREFYVTDSPERFRMLGSRFLPGGRKGKSGPGISMNHDISLIKEVKLMEVWNEAGWKKK